MRRLLLISVLVPFACLPGCPVFQSQDTPAEQFKGTDPATRGVYWIYVPSYYSGDRTWPLVITLHGTYGFDSAGAQIKEWKALAERQGLIVVAPKLRSVQGILPTVKSWREKDLVRDERVILSCLRHIRRNYSIDPRAILLTGFSAGGYPMYYTGLRNPTKFTAMAARACNSRPDIFEGVSVTKDLRQLPIIIIHGKDDLSAIGSQSWQAYRWLREHRCFKTERHKVRGGHIRQPEAAWRYWRRHLPKELSRRPVLR